MFWLLLIIFIFHLHEYFVLFWPFCFYFVVLQSAWLLSLPSVFLFLLTIPNSIPLLLILLLIFLVLFPLPVPLLFWLRFAFPPLLSPLTPVRQETCWSWRTVWWWSIQRISTACRSVFVPLFHADVMCCAIDLYFLQMQCLRFTSRCHHISIESF